MKKYIKTNKQLKTIILDEAYFGTPVQELAQKYKIRKNTLYYWIRKDRKIGKSKINLRDYNNLVKHSQRQAEIINILQETAVHNLPKLEDRYKIMDTYFGKYPINVLCEAFQVTRGAYHYNLRSKDNPSNIRRRHAKLLAEVSKVHEESGGIYGAEKICAALRRKGWIVSERFTRELMQELNIHGATSYKKKEKYKEAWVTRHTYIWAENMNITGLNQVWVSDIKSYPINHGRVHICVILDAYSRKILAIKSGARESSNLVNKTLIAAMEERGNPEGIIYHTDNGRVYCSYTARKLYEKYKIKKTYSRPAHPKDNPVAEKFMHTLGIECLYDSYGPRSIREVTAKLEEYKNKYNKERLHKSLNYKTPDEYEKMRKNCFLK